MNPIDRIPPQVIVHRRDKEGEVIKAHVTVQPAVGDPFDVLCKVIPEEHNLHTWVIEGNPPLTEHQQQYLLYWTAALAEGLLMEPAEWEEHNKDLSGRH